MAEKTILEKAAEKVGYGLAMAEDVAGSVKTAVGGAVATVTEALTPAKKVSKPLAKKVPVKSTPKKAPAEKGCEENCSEEVTKPKRSRLRRLRSSPLRDPQRKLAAPNGELKQGWCYTASIQRV